MAYGEATLVASAARTASGDSGLVSLESVLGVPKGDSLRVQLDVTASAGTAPTLDVIVQDSLDGTNWNDLVTFTQATGTTREVKNLTTPFANRLRVKWTVGGTGPSFTFSVAAALS